MIFFDLYLGVKFPVNEQAKTVQLSKRNKFNKEDYSLVFESSNFQVHHTQLPDNIMRNAGTDAYVNNFK